MAKQTNNLEELIRTSLEEAKKKAYGKKREEEEESEEEEEEEEEESSKPKLKKKKMEEEVEAVEESTTAASSIAAKGDAKAPIKHAPDTDQNHFNATMAQYGSNKDHGVPDNSAKNSATIDSKLGKGPKTKDAMPKLNVKEDLEPMFDGEDLSEDFKEKAATLFEAAISARMAAETARLEEEYEAKIQEDLSVFQEELTTKIDAYLDYVVEQWMTDNQVAIESALRNEIMEEFIDGLKNLFAEHYIDVPEQKVDVLEALAEKVNALEEKLDESITENVELRGVIAASQAKTIFEELSSDLALTQQEKFAALVEGVEFDGNFETYEKKLRIIKESYFKNDNTSYSTNFEEETFEGDVGSQIAIDPQVGRYLNAITRTVKK